MTAVVVEYYKDKAGSATAQARFSNAELHISTHGVLIVRRPDRGEVLRTYNNQAWYAAHAED